MTGYVLATANPDKAREMVELLGPRIAVAPRPPGVADVDETGQTLVDNARLKASAVAAATGLVAIADDTGLEVTALGGAPGVRSARYAGEGASYADNVAKLLEALAGAADRSACFRTVAVAKWPDGAEIVCDGTAPGVITTTPRGAAGFGYDAVFVPEHGGGRTFAEMSPADKHRISHRGRALRALAARLP